MFRRFFYILLSLPVIVFGFLCHFHPELSTIAFITLSVFHLCLGIFFYFNHNFKALIWLIFMEGLALKLFYITYTPYTERQHDVGTFSYTSGGHFAYIYYVLKNHTLPFFTQIPQAPICHPPLHYILSASLLSIFPNYENLQYLTLIWSFGTTILTYLCLKLAIKNENYLVLGALFCNFFPAFIIYSGSLNNDILNTFLCTLSIFYFMRYIQKDKPKYLIYSSFFLGLAGLTKLSVIPLYMGTCLFFLLRLLMKKISFKQATKNVILYSSICLPLILIWPLYIYIHWDGFSVFSPHFWYSPSWSEIKSYWFSGYNPFLHLENFTHDKYLYVGSYSLFDRLGIILEPLSEPYILFGHDRDLMIPEYNVWMLILKTSLFDEYALFRYATSMLSTIGFDLSVLLLGLAYILLIFFIISLFKTSKKEPLILYCKSIVLAVILIIIYFGLKSPVVCTVSFRYIALLFPCLCFIFGKYVQDILSPSTKKWDIRSKNLIGLTLFLFSWISFLIYTLYGIFYFD